MRKRYIADEHGHWIEWREPQVVTGLLVMPDIEPYKSMITGEMIQSRSRHREHLREHGCIEIGNEAIKTMDYYSKIPDVEPKQRHELIRAQIDAMSHDQFRRAIKVDADRVKWTSRED